MIVTIDGPAGAGKSTVAKRLAERLGFDFLNSGAMYRAVALAVKRHGVAPTDEAKVVDLTNRLRIDFVNDRVCLDGEDVSQLIHTFEISEIVPIIADYPGVRAKLSELQRQFAQGRNVVTEGRDQGSVVFPDADVKFFLVASPEERARRRWKELKAKGEPIEYEDVLRQIIQRDQHDMNRSVGRLTRPPDAVDINTDKLSIDEVVDRLEEVVRSRTGDKAP